MSARWRNIFHPLQEAFERLDKKRDDTAPPTQKDVKKLVRHFLDPNIGEKFDNLIDQCYEASAALFSISVQCMVARSLFRNPEDFGRKVKKEDGNDFHNNPTMTEMKKYLINPFKRQQQTERAASASRNLLTEFASSEGETEEPPRKAKRKELANVWTDDEEQQQEGEPLHATPSKKKERKKGKGKGKCKNNKEKKNNE